MPGQKTKAEIIDERKANLPLPDDPPVPSDWTSLDERNVNITKGSKDSDAATRAAAAASTMGLRGALDIDRGSGGEKGGPDVNEMRRDSSENEEHLRVLPKDALERDR